HYALRITHYALRITHYALRITHYALRITTRRFSTVIDPPARGAGARFVAARVHDVPPSGIRKFFDIVATMKDVISLGIGEPDFVTPAPIVESGIESLRQGHPIYTSNSGILELRQALSEQLNKLYTV